MIKSSRTLKKYVFYYALIETISKEGEQKPYSTSAQKILRTIHGHSEKTITQPIIMEDNVYMTNLFKDGLSTIVSKTFDFFELLEESSTGFLLLISC